MLEITIDEARNLYSRGATIYFESAPDCYQKVDKNTRLYDYPHDKYYVSNSIIAVQNVLSELRAEMKKHLDLRSTDQWQTGRNHLINWFLGRTDKYMKLDSKKVSN